MVRSSSRPPFSFLDAMPEKRLCKQRHLPPVDLLELPDFLLRLAVMAESVIALRGILVLVQLERRSDECIGHQSDDARGVRLERQLRHREHEIELLEEQLLVLDVGRGRLVAAGFGFISHARAVCIRSSTSRTDVTY